MTLATRGEAERVESSADSASCDAITDGGRTVVSSSEDTMVRVWERDGEQWVSSELNRHTDRVSAVAVSTDGRLVLSGSRCTTARVWERERGNG